MNTKQMFNNNLLNISDLLLKTYKDLSLDETDYVLIINLIKDLSNGQTFLSIKRLEPKLTLSRQQIQDRVEKYRGLGYLKVTTMMTNNTLTEKYDLDGLFTKIDSLLFIASEQINEQKTVNEVNEVISNFDDFFSGINQNDVKTIKSWIDEFSVNQVKSALIIAERNKVRDMNYIDKILVNNSERFSSEDDLKQVISNMEKLANE